MHGTDNDSIYIYTKAVIMIAYINKSCLNDSIYLHIKVYVEKFEIVNIICFNSTCNSTS